MSAAQMWITDERWVVRFKADKDVNLDFLRPDVLPPDPPRGRS